MSVTDVDCTATEGSLCEFPEFGLQWRPDDPDDPSEVTVFPSDADGDALATTWLSAAVDDAVALADAR